MDAPPADGNLGLLWMAFALALAAVNLVTFTLKRFVIPRITLLNGQNGQPPLLPAESGISDADLNVLQSIYPKLTTVAAAVERVEQATTGPQGCVNRQAQIITAQNNTADRMADVARAMTHIAEVMHEIKGAIK